MTVEEINALSVDELQEMMGGNPSPEEIITYRDQLIADAEKRLELESRLDALVDKKYAFAVLFPEIPNMDKHLEGLFKGDLVSAESLIAQLEVKDAELQAEKQQKKDKKDADALTIQSFRNDPNPKLEDVIAVLKLIL